MRPIYYDGLLYIAQDNTVQAIGAATAAKCGHGRAERAEVWRDQKGKSGYAGGMLTTAGDLVFYGSETGHFQAVNASTGDILYNFQLGARPKSGPITYVLNGKQYVAQLTGVGATAGYSASHLEHGGHLVAFTR